MADMLYVTASGKRLASSAKPFSAIVRREKRPPPDSRTGGEILNDLLAALEGAKK